MKRYILTALQKNVINSEGKVILKSCPGSGKTFVVANKMVNETKLWKHKNKGIALLSFTNIAGKEMEKQIDKVSSSHKIGYPHYIGTLDRFISQYLFLPFGHLIMNCKERPTIIQQHSICVQGYANRIWMSIPVE